MKITNCNWNQPAGTYTQYDCVADLDKEDPATGLRPHYGGSCFTTEDNRLHVPWPDCAPSGGGYITPVVAGKQMETFRIYIPPGGQSENVGLDADGKPTVVLPPFELTDGSNPFRKQSLRPAPKMQQVITPFDPPADGCDIHTSLPPEQVIPAKPTIDFWRGDPWGVMVPHPESWRWFPGANSTPIGMIMSYQLPYYTPSEIDVILTAHCERNLWNFLLDRGANGQNDADLVAMMKMLVSWGFFPTFWAMGTTHPTGTWDEYKVWANPLADAIEAAGIADKVIWIVGEELNSYARWGEGGVDTMVQNLAARKSFKVACHFTSNYPGMPGADVNGDVTQWYRKLSHLGYWGTMWQSNPYESPALMGARMWDTRKYMGNADPNLKCVAFEHSGEPQLYGQRTETEGARIGWELLCCTRDNASPNAPAVAGATAARYPDGTPL